MVQKDEFDNAVESLRAEIAVIETRISNMKIDVIRALRDENIRLKNIIKTLKAYFESFDIIRNKMDHYSRRNNIAVDGIPSRVKKRELEDKCIEVLVKINIKIHQYDTEACHRKQLSVSLTKIFAQKY